MTPWLIGMNAKPAMSFGRSEARQSYKEAVFIFNSAWSAWLAAWSPRSCARLNG
jgi:hypothetical protein